MRLPLREHHAESVPGLSGPVRMDRRTGSLVPRLRPGDIAVIDHLDLDRANAESLVERGVVAVVNASPFISGRYPNLGPDLLARAGVMMVDDVGPDIFAHVKDGSRVRLHDGAVLVGDRQVADGRVLDVGEITERMQDARSGLTTQLQSFTHNTTEFLRREQELLLHGQGIPTLDTDLEGRPVVVVVRGYDYREDLRGLRGFIKERRPALIGVDGGAEALVAAGHQPDIVVVGEDGLTQAETGDGRGGAVSDRALRGAREVVLHADGSGRTPGGERLNRLAVRHQRLTASGTSEDVALLLADARGASLIVAVGTHATLDEFLDRQRTGLASTFLTRLRVGPKLVDARCVPQLHSTRFRLWQLALVMLAGFVALGAAIATTPVGQEWWSSFSDAVRVVWTWIQGLLS